MRLAEHRLLVPAEGVTYRQERWQVEGLSVDGGLVLSRAGERIVLQAQLLRGPLAGVSCAAEHRRRFLKLLLMSLISGLRRYSWHSRLLLGSLVLASAPLSLAQLQPPAELAAPVEPAAPAVPQALAAPAVAPQAPAPRALSPRLANDPPAAAEAELRSGSPGPAPPL